MINRELVSGPFEKEKPTCPYILHFRSQTQLDLAFAKDWLRLYMTTKETSTVNGSQLGNLLNTNQLCLQETISFYKQILWMEEILHQLVDGLSHCNPIIYSVL